MLRCFCLTVLAFTFVAKGFAQFGDCLYQYELEKPTALIHEVKLPPTAFAKTGGDLYNFRVYGVASSGDTLEMPYAYQVPKAKVLWLPLNQLNAGKTAQGDRFTFQAATDERIQSLELSISNTDFEGMVTLEGADRLGDWQTVVSDYRIIGLTQNGGPYRFTTLKFKPSVYPYYRITIKGIKELKLEEVKLADRSISRSDTLRFDSRLKGPEQLAAFPKTSIYEVELAEEVLIDNLTLNITDTLRYIRQVEIQVLQDSFKQGEEIKYRYQTLGRGSVSSLDPNRSIGFPATVAHHLRVLIRDQDNQPLKVESIATGVEERRINVRFSGAESYYLTYGCASLGRPSYDVTRELATLTQRPPTLDLARLNSFVFDPAASVEGLFSNQLWLYGALALVAGLLGWMAIGMMKK